MTGPEHYREAERLLTAAAGAPTSLAGKSGPEAIRQTIKGLHAAAQAHATLALAAVTAAEQATAYDGDEDHSRTRGWAGVA
jgi:hypothetical protein